MQRRIHYKTKAKIQRLYKQEISIAEISRQTKVPYKNVYCLTRLKERGFNSYHEYIEHRAKQRRFTSGTEYYKHLAKQRQKKPINKNLAALIKNGLRSIEKSQLWLAREIGTTPQVVSLYCQAKNYPSFKILDKIYSALESEGFSIDKNSLEGML